MVYLNGGFINVEKIYPYSGIFNLQSVFETLSNTPTISFVGYASATGINGSEISIPLNSLTGGIATSPSEGDIVIVAYGAGSFTTAYPTSSRTVITSGYADIFSDMLSTVGSGTSAHIGNVSYKIMGVSPDSSVTISSVSGGTTSYMAGAGQAWVFRSSGEFSIGGNIISDTSTSLTPASQTIEKFTNSVFTNSVFLSFIFGGHSRGAAEVWSSASFDNFYSVGANDTRDFSLGVGYKSPTSFSSFTPSFSLVVSDSSSYTHSIALVELITTRTFL